MASNGANNKLTTMRFIDSENFVGKEYPLITQSRKLLRASFGNVCLGSVVYLR